VLGILELLVALSGGVVGCGGGALVVGTTGPGAQPTGMFTVTAPEAIGRARFVFYLAAGVRKPPRCPSFRSSGVFPYDETPMMKAAVLDFMSAWVHAETSFGGMKILTGYAASKKRLAQELPPQR
jgi:hypothetical protein